MNKNAIKKFAIDARNKLIASVTDKAGMLGITPDNCSEAITKGVDFEVYKTAAGTEVTLNKKQCEQRRKLVDQIHARGFEAVVEEVAYTWFNRICAIRFMEVNDYMYPVRVRVLSSEKEGKNEPDVVTMAPDIDWNFTDKEREEIIDAKMNNRLDDLFRMLFIKQCNLLHEVLPGLFEETEDYTEMLLNISVTNEDDVIRMLIDEKRGIPEEDFNVNTIGEDGQPTGQVEIIGWLYQYYNTELKDDTFAKLKKNVKITKERIPAATQLFTPDWIVRYMVENSVGRIWIEHLRAVNLSIDEKATAEKFGWKYYLPEAEQEETVNVKLAEIRTTYKDLKPTDITCIDPCMGSGHILIAMFDVLMDIYESAGYDKREATFDIVEHNIHGLDIDQRAYQLAYFAVMMKGRGYNRRFFKGKNDVKPALKVYAIMESNDIEKKHLQFFGTSMPEVERKSAVAQVEYLFHTFEDAREYGSILNVEVHDWNLLYKFIRDLDDNGQVTFESWKSDETQEKLQRLVEVAEVMSKKYDVAVTNPPYLNFRSINVKLLDFCNSYYNDTKSDLFCVFIEKCHNMCKLDGVYSLITMQNWMYLDSFSEFRNRMLNDRYCENLLHLGMRAFETNDVGTIVKTSAFVFRKKYLRFKTLFLDLRKFDNSINKKNAVENIDYGKSSYVHVMYMHDLTKIQNAPIAYKFNKTIVNMIKQGKTINNYGTALCGIQTGNNSVFLKIWYEVEFDNIAFGMYSNEEYNLSGKKWVPQVKGGLFRKWYGNFDYVINMYNNAYDISHANNTNFRLRDPKNYFLEAITWSHTSDRFGARFLPAGNLCNVEAPAYFLDNAEKTYEVLGFFNSKVAGWILAQLDDSLHYSVSDILGLPFIHNSYDTGLVKNSIALSKKDWNLFETSWDFKCHPLIVVISKNKALFDDRENIDLAECYTYWENDCNERFNHIKANEEELNRIFIDIYGLQNELTPEVEDKDITVRKADLQRDIKSLISYAVGCMFGRYSLNKEGLVYVGGEWDESAYSTFLPDRDNVIPICDEEYFSDDIVLRFCEWMKIVYGEKSLETNLDFIAKALGNKGDTSREIIRSYFLNDFFKDHCNTYSVMGSGKRPIYWLFDSGKQNGFKALIYMHRYDVDTVGRVRTDYLHKAQKYVETAMQSAQYMIDNATSSSEKSKATKAVTKYTKQLAEMKIYDEAIAHVANQRIEIDLDDGVKVNYAKFQGVEVAQEGKKALKVDLLAKI